jgi:hypothetical protein
MDWTNLPNIYQTPSAPNKRKQFLDFFRVVLKKLFESKKNETMQFSGIVNSTYFWKQNTIHEDWQKNLNQFLHNIWHNSNVLDENTQKQLLEEQQNMSIYDYHLDECSFTIWIQSLSIELMIEDMQSYLWAKKNIFLVDVFSWTYSIPWVINPFHTAYWLTWYLWIDLLDALRAESTQKAFEQADEQWVHTWFLQTDAYSGLCLLPDHSVDVLLINGVDYTITSDVYMWKVMGQAKRILKQDGIISGISNGFLESNSRTKIHMEWYHIHNIGIKSYCTKK